MVKYPEIQVSKSSEILELATFHFHGPLRAQATAAAPWEVIFDHHFWRLLLTTLISSSHPSRILHLMGEKEHHSGISPTRAPACTPSRTFQPPVSKNGRKDCGA